MTARALLLVPASLAIVAALPAPAAADGLPGTGVVPSPVSAPGGEVEYVAKRAKRNTVLRERRLDGGPVLRSLELRGRYSVPAVAYDGSPSGLAADGRTLVLINPRKRWPRKQTTFAVVDAKRMDLRRHIRLSGDFSFDAISPDGRVIYLIEYLSPRDQTAYAVRAYDMRARRLFHDPVVDPSEPDEDMSGVPLSRVSDTEGRWAYTLYSGAKHPFVHALDTERRTAVCIDLDLRNLRGVGLEIHGGRLDVVGESGLLARIDTATHRVIAAPGKRPARVKTEAKASAGTPWLPIAAPSAALILLAAAGWQRARTRSGSRGVVGT
jgi:hypothetical protein